MPEIKLHKIYLAPQPGRGMNNFYMFVGCIVPIASDLLKKRFPGSAEIKTVEASYAADMVCVEFVMASFVLFYTGFPILQGAYVSLMVWTPNMDLLVAMVALGAYLYSWGHYWPALQMVTLTLALRDGPN